MNGETSGLKCKTMSIMFVDVKGYSDLKENQLRTFFSSVLQGTADILGKQETIDTNSWGDGVVGFFEEPISAARCALRLRDYFDTQHWEDIGLPKLTVRIGLHSGPVWSGFDPIRNRNGVVGTQVNLAARIEPIVPAGHIFGTNTFISLLQRGNDPTIAYDKVGLTALAKHWGEEDLFNIRWSKDKGFRDDLVMSNLMASESVAPLSTEQFARRSDPSSQAMVTWRKRGDISDTQWRELFSSAKKRIWLLGHSMHNSMAPAGSGRAIADRLANGVDVRLVVLDPFDASNSQIDDIAKEVAEPDLRRKIRNTLRYALSHRVSNRPLMSVGITHASIHTSLVIVDNRFLITVYSHNWEMGDSGMTLDLYGGTDEVCNLFENDFLWHWRQSYPFRDEVRSLPRIEWRVLNFPEKVRSSLHWYSEPDSKLEPPYLVVINPTYTCRHGPRDTGPGETHIEGPHARKLLCPNCMYGDILNTSKRNNMEVHRFSTLCQELSDMGVGIIEISGGGEPLHHPQATELLTNIREMRNAGLLKSEIGLLSNLEALVDCDFSSVLLDSLTYVRWSWPESAELQPSLRAKYLLALQGFISSKATSRSGVRVGVKILLTKNSASHLIELCQLVRQLFEIGIDHVKIRSLRSKGQLSSPDMDQVRHAEDHLAQLAYELHEEGLVKDEKSFEIDLRARNVHAGYQCKISTLVSVVEPTGDVRMCWNDLGAASHRVIGNVFSGGFRDIWGTSRHRRVCQTMDAASVCNTEAGCDCRLVGYQETAQRFVNWELPYQFGDFPLVLKDQFL